MRVLGISGSLRTGSYNTALLRASGERLPAGVRLELVTCGDLPHYSQDLDRETKPSAVQGLLDRVQRADALLIATPEYNYSVPGALKNAIDWASRPAFQSPLRHKPCAILSAARSATGGARAQAHLKLVLSGTLTPVYPAPELLVPMAQEKFDEAGHLVDAQTDARLRRYLEEFTVWVAGRCALG